MADLKVAFIGLGAMGQGMATVLLRAGFSVHGFDVSEVAMGCFQQAGGTTSCCPAEAARDAKMVIVMVFDSNQVDSVLFGPEGAVSALSHGAVIILCATLSPAYLKRVESQLSGDEKGILLVDAPVSGGVTGAANGTLTIMASGSNEALVKATPVLSAMSRKLFTIDGGVGAGSKVKMVNQVLAGVQIAAAAEAMVLGACAGINTQVLYDIISNAAGNSCVFVSRGSQMISGDMTPHAALNIFVKDLGIVLGEAKGIPFPLPLTAIAHQQFLLGSASGYGHQADAAVVKIWEKCAGISVVASSEGGAYASLEEPAKQLLAVARRVDRIGFLGLGAMGFGMATTLIRKKFAVCGFDVFTPVLLRFGDAGGKIAKTPREAAEGSEVLIVMVANEKQAADALFGDSGAVSGLSRGSVVILCSTVSPGFVQHLDKCLQDEDRGLHLVDAPVSGGVSKAADGTLTIMAAGLEEALRHTIMVLSAMSEKLYIIEGGVGAGSSVKMVNQLLAGVHIAVAAEAMAFGASLGLDTKNLYDVISHAAGSSWMFVNRVPHMLEADYTPHSAMNIFVKDLGIVLSEAKMLNVPLYLAAASHQQFLLGAAAGWGREDDSAVVKIFERLAQVTVAAPKASITAGEAGNPSCASKYTATEYPVLSKRDKLKSLEPEWPGDLVNNFCKTDGGDLVKSLVVLDDDPTGTQTVHGVTVLTEWGIATIKEEFEKGSTCFFILTNTRALSGEKASLLIKDICSNVKAAAALVCRMYTIVLRGDSTLRGHFPQEPDAATSVIGKTDAWIICPSFPQGGRYTINDIHYVEDEDMLLPAGQTEFARDATFGYKSSNLKEWVEEKTGGQMKLENVVSVSIETIRKGGPQAVCNQLCGLSKGSVCIVNAASDRDIEVFASGMIQAEIAGKRFLCRTAATFVAACIGLKPKAIVTPKDMWLKQHMPRISGGLIVVGSYVPKTTKQVEVLKDQCGHFIHFLEVEVRAVATGLVNTRKEVISQIAHIANAYIAAGKDTLIVTSRELMTGNDSDENLGINSNVSSALVEIVKQIQTRPRYLLAKGGITSSDLATKALGVRKAEVVGQALVGVPLWKLGPGCRHEGLPYIVFPGNVGRLDSLANIVQAWALPSSRSTKELLLAAANGAYALGAFNVYNLEGIAAVVAAAEAEASPAILQVHPGALKHGQQLLVSCCVTAAKHAMVPITVHFDHGSNEQDILKALDMGFDSIMVDGSHLPFYENILFTKRITAIAHGKQMTVEAELGRLAGTEDGLTVEEYEEKLTDVTQAGEFLKETKVDALAVCIGNVHGKYPPSGPRLRLDLLKKLHDVAITHNAVLVLHGASGLPKGLLKDCIKHGVCKFNVNTEIRSAFMGALQTPQKELLDVINNAKDSMKAVVAEKLHMFGSAGKASW
eukprot:c25012_g1_i1 orf=491-4702(-)